MTTKTETAPEKPKDQKLAFEGDRKVIVRTRVRAKCFFDGCPTAPDFVKYYLYKNPRVNLRSVAFGLGEHDITTDMFDYKRYCCTEHRQLEMDTKTPVECVGRPMHRAKDWPERFLVDADIEVGGQLARDFLIAYDALKELQEERAHGDKSAETPGTDIQDPVEDRGGSPGTSGEGDLGGGAVCEGTELGDQPGRNDDDA